MIEWLDSKTRKQNKEFFDSWVTDLIASALGVALITLVAFDLFKESNYIGATIAFIFGLILQIPLIYFKLWGLIFDTIR